MSSMIQIIPTLKFTVFDVTSPITTSTPLVIQVPAPYTDLTDFVANDAIQKLGHYLAKKSLFVEDDDTKYERTNFNAAGLKHADEIKLQNRGGYGDHTEWPTNFDFHDCRKRRGSAEYWRHNSNANQLPGLVTFVHELPFFKETGKVTIILSSAYSRGVEHVDHKFDDLVSEFVWIRTGIGAHKRFFIRDSNGVKRYVEKDDQASSDVGNQGYCVWFDDHHSHCTETIVDASYSIRIDGVFTDEFRKYICDVGVFKTARLRSVFNDQRSIPLSSFAKASHISAIKDAYASCDVKSNQ